MTKASEVERQFARRFVGTDWMLFKQMAEANLSEAAHLKKSDMRRSKVKPLLARNVRKRLLIGLGVELLLKAAFLKAGYAINLCKGKPAFPIRLDAVGDRQMLPTTVRFDDCIKHLTDAVQLGDAELTKEGLKIAKVFRNKEAHSVLDAHRYEAETYRTIEAAQKALYRDAFAENLSVTIAMTEDDKAAWKIKGQQHEGQA